jgi:predicted DNA-binding transcriptional regulator AlpA
MEIIDFRKTIDGNRVNEDEKFLKLNEVLAHCCLCRAQLYKLMAKGLFPPSHKMLSGRVVWLSTDINIWRSMTSESFKSKYETKLKVARESAA